MSTKITRASLQRWSSSPHTYQSAFGLVASWRLSWNHGCWSEVWFITMSAIDAHAALVRLVDQLAGVVDVAVLGEHREEVGDVVATVAQGRAVEGQQPDAVDAEPLQVVELLDQAPKVAGAVVGGVEEAPDEHLVEDGPLVPARVGGVDGGRHSVPGWHTVSEVTCRRWATWPTVGSRRT